METVKMKGSEIIERWHKANKPLQEKGRRLGEVGGMMRNLGYDVHMDGFSCCTFSERGLNLWYEANNFDDVWHAVPRVNIGQERYSIPVGERKHYLTYIDPDAEYEIEVRLSVAEKFEKGLVKYDRFVVMNQNGRQIFDKWYFDSFEAADEFARKKCQEEIDRRNSPMERDVRHCYNSEVRNSKQLALEHIELRHYQWYNYQDHPHWISVEGY